MYLRLYSFSFFDSGLLLLCSVMTIAMLVGLPLCSYAEVIPGEGPFLLWTSVEIRPEAPTPVISPDGIIYIGANEGVYALNFDGDILWHYETRDKIEAPPTLDKDGNVYVGDTDGIFYSLTPDGGLRWQYQTGYVIRGGAAIGYNETIYVGSLDGYLYAFSPDGDVLWKTVTGKGKGITSSYMNVETSPVIGRDGTIYVASKDYHIYAINPWGTYKWQFRTDNGNWETEPALGPDETLYYASKDNFLYAIAQDGTMKWKYMVDNTGISSPVIGTDGTIYIGAHNLGGLLALNPDGTEKWLYDMEGYNLNSPSIGHDGTIYITCRDNHLYAIEPDGELKWRYEFSGGSPALTPGGLIIMTGKGSVHGVYTSNRGYDQDASWPGSVFSPQRSIISDDVTLPPMYTVRGQVAMPDSTPIMDVMVSVEGLATTTDEYGYYALSLPDGEYTVTFHLNSTVIPETAEVIVDGADAFVEMYPPAQHALRGRVVDSAGPVSDVTVFVGSKLYVTDESGEYSFDLIDGAYTLEFMLEDGCFPRMKDIVVDGEDMIIDDHRLNRKAWQLTMGERSMATPVPGENGTVYFLEALRRESIMHHLDRDGVSLHEYKFDSDLRYTPSQAPDGTLYVPTWDQIIALNPDLTHKWTFTVSELGAGGAPGIGSDGTLYFGAIEQLYALNPDGTVRWKHPTGDRSRTPAIADDGSVYFTCTDKNLYAFEPDGTEKWIRDMDSYYCPTPVIGDDGILYFGGYDYKFYAMNPDGTLKWTVETGSATSESAVLDKSGDIYFTNQDGRLYAVARDGTLKWTHLIDRYILEPFYYEPADEIWVSNDAQTFAFAPDGTVKWRHTPALKYLMTDSTGRLYASVYPEDVREMYLYAFDMAELPVLVEDGFSDNAAYDQDGKPSMITLHQNYPNPFNPETTITFTLRADTEVIVDIYSIAGQHVTRLTEERMVAGPHHLKWDGSRFAAGVYLTRISAGGEVGMHKMLLLK